MVTVVGDSSGVITLLPDQVVRYVGFALIDRLSSLLHKLILKNRLISFIIFELRE